MARLVLSLSLTPDVGLRLEKYAKESGRSLSYTANALLGHQLDLLERDKKLVSA